MSLAPSLSHSSHSPLATAVYLPQASKETLNNNRQTDRQTVNNKGAVKAWDFSHHNNNNEETATENNPQTQNPKPKPKKKLVREAIAAN
jgi:hypothetical protein